MPVPGAAAWPAPELPRNETTSQYPNESEDQDASAGQCECREEEQKPQVNENEGHLTFPASAARS